MHREKQNKLGLFDSYSFEEAFSITFVLLGVAAFIKILFFM